MMKELEYIREEIRILSSDCKQNISFTMNFIVTLWSALGAFILWIFDQNTEMGFIILFMITFLTSGYIYASACKQNAYRTKIVRLETYIAVFHSESKWDKLNYAERSNKKSKEWLDAAFPLLLLTLAIINVACFALYINIVACSSNRCIIMLFTFACLIIQVIYLIACTRQITKAPENTSKQLDIWKDIAKNDASE